MKHSLFLQAIVASMLVRALQSFRHVQQHGRGIAMSQLVAASSKVLRRYAATRSGLRLAPLSSTVVDKNELDVESFDLPTNDNSPNLLRVRHTTAHVMAMAVQKLYPEAQVTIGPWIDGGYVRAPGAPCFVPGYRLITLPTARTRNFNCTGFTTISSSPRRSCPTAT